MRNKLSVDRPLLYTMLSAARASLQSQLPAKYKKKGDTEPEKIALEAAIELLEAKRAAEPRGNRGGGRKAKRTGAAGGKNKSGVDAEGVSYARPRPKSGFFQFCAERREARAAEAGGEQQSKLTATELSEEWKALSDKGRAKYNATAAKAMEEWKEEHARVSWVVGKGKRPLAAGYHLTGYELYIQDSNFSVSGLGCDSFEEGWRGLSEDERGEFDRRTVELAEVSDAGSVVHVPTRPKSGFFQFCSERREACATQAGGARQSKVTAKELSREWKALSDKGRAAYNAPAAEAMREWKGECARLSWVAGKGKQRLAAGFDLTGFELYIQDKKFSLSGLECDSFEEGWRSLSEDGREEFDRRAVEKVKVGIFPCACAVDRIVAK